MDKRVRAITMAFLCSSLILLSSPTVAGDDDSPRENSLHPGSWSIQFQIEDDIGFKPYNGMAISMKRHTSRKSAFRTGLNVQLDFSDRSTDSQSLQADTVRSEIDTEFDRNSQTFQLDFLYMRYPNPDATINWFFGMGPMVRFTRTDNDGVSLSTASVSERERTTNSLSKTWVLGALGAAGVEWFAAKGISFHAEYRASAVYGKTARDDVTIEVTRFDEGEDSTVQNESNSDSSFWDFSSVDVLLGVSLYF